MQITWDHSKSELLKETRGFLFDDVAGLLAAPYVGSQRSEDPEQFQAIGMVLGKLVTLIYEYRESFDGYETIWLVTYWPATKFERRFYEQAKI